MPKRIGFLYEKMEDKGFIRRVILEASRGKRKRREVRRVLKNLDEYVDKTYEMIVSESFVPTPPKERETDFKFCAENGGSQFGKEVFGP